MLASNTGDTPASASLELRGQTYGTTMGSPPVLMMWKRRLGDAEPLAQTCTAFHYSARPGHHASGTEVGYSTPDADPSSQHARPLDAQPMSSDLLVSRVPGSIQQPDLQYSQAAQIFTQCGLRSACLSTANSRRKPEQQSSGSLGEQTHPGQLGLRIGGLQGGRKCGLVNTVGSHLYY